MKNKRLPIWIIVCCLMLSIRAAAASNLLKNGELDGNGPTEGWSVLSYLPENYSVTVTDGIAMLSSDEPNDLQLMQSVDVE